MNATQTTASKKVANVSTKNALGHDEYDKMTGPQLVAAFNKLVSKDKQVKRFADRTAALKRIRAAAKGKAALAKVEKAEAVEKVEVVQANVERHERGDGTVKYVFHYPEGTLVAELSRKADNDKPREAIAGTQASVVRSKRVKRVIYLATAKKHSKPQAGSKRKKVLDAIMAAGEKGILMDDLTNVVGFRAVGYVQKLLEKNHVGVKYERADGTEDTE